MEGKKIPSLARLPGQTQDPRARQLRAEIQKSTSEGDALFDERRIKTPEGEIDTDLLQIEAYATASFMIEEFWDHFKTRVQGLPAPIEPAARVNPIEEAKAFTQAYDDFLSPLQREYQLSLIERIKSKTPMTKEDTLMMRFMDAAFERMGKRGGIPFPSMKDLIAIFGRIAGITSGVYARDRGAVPDSELVMRLLTHPAARHTLSGMMTNSRALLNPIVSKLEGSDHPDLDNHSRAFKAEHFAIGTDSSGKEYIGLQPALVSWIRTQYEGMARKFEEEGTVPARALQCPVLYTGKFDEMYGWIAGEYAKFIRA